MKRITFFSIFLCAIAILSWQCSDKTETDNLDLKYSLNSSIVRLNDAIIQIKATRGYQVLTLNDESSLKSASADQFLTCTDSIELADIKGIYEYRPANFNKWCYSCLDRLFKKTGDSEYLIVKMPKIKIFSPLKFRTSIMADSLLSNNFEITATDYHYYFSRGFLFDYKLSATCVLDSISIGSLDIHSSRETPSVRKYSAQFSFEKGFGLNVYTSNGDTAISSFGLSDSNGVIFKEIVKTIKMSNKKHREKEYLLTIGNIDIKRMPSKDSIEIYVSGILQTNAKIEIIDNDTIEEKSFCKKRDFQITFDDGTTAKLSELTGPALTTLASLVESMKNIYFATNIVDYIAWNIRKNNCIKN